MYYKAFIENNYIVENENGEVKHALEMRLQSMKEWLWAETWYSRLPQEREVTPQCKDGSYLQKNMFLNITFCELRSVAVYSDIQLPELQIVL